MRRTLSEEHLPLYKSRETSREKTIYHNESKYFELAKQRINNYERDTRQLLIREDYGLNCVQHPRK